MKSIFYLYYLSFLFLFSCSNHRIKIESDLSVLRLKGKVKRIEKTTYNAVEKFGEVQKADIAEGIYEVNPNDYYSILNFDEIGYVTKREFPNQDENYAGYAIIEYDGNHREIKSTSFYKKGKVETSLTKRYNDKLFTCTTLAIYNSNNIKDSEIEYYNNKNRIFKLDVFERDTLIYRDIYEYDNRNLCIRKRSYDKDGELSSLRLNDYDEKGNLISEVDSLTLGKVSNSFSQYKYNDNNDLTEISRPKETYNVKSLFSYKYDTNGNWIERIEYLGNLTTFPRYLTERKIEYY